MTMTSRREDEATCTNCLFFSKQDYMSSCTHPDLRDWDPVYGWSKTGFPSLLRGIGGKCGPEGRHFVPRPASPRKSLWRWFLSW